MKQVVIDHIQQIVLQEYGVKLENLQLSIPPKNNMGDLCFGCFVLAKDLKKSPMLIAQELGKFLKSEKYTIPEIQKIDIIGGYINFFLSPDIFSSALTSFMHQGIYTSVETKSNDFIYIDYIGANVGKPLHIGHMCTPLQGQVIINAFKKLNYKVISDSHIGDWGIIFGKLISGYRVYGDPKKLEENAVEHLFEIYVKISADAEKDVSLDQEFRDAFKKLSLGDKQMKQIWEKFTRKSIHAMNLLLARLHVFPKYNIGESFYEGLGLAKMENYPDLKYSMHEIVDELISKNIAIKNDDGSVGVVFPDELKLPSCILQKRDGTHGYFASDLASIKYRMDNWNPKKIVYFVDVRQKLHFEQAFAIARMVGWVGDDIEMTHAYNGFISLKDGAMSTRKGKIIKLEALLHEGEKRASNIISEKRTDISVQQTKELSEIISIGAIKYGYLKKSRESDSIFDWDEYMSFEGNSGPYIQYAYVRAQKILGAEKYVPEYDNLSFETGEEKNLIAQILLFPEVVSDLTTNYHPHILCNYIYDLTKIFSSMYANVPILSEKKSELKKSRLALLSAFSLIMQESFEILGISLPKEM